MRPFSGLLDALALGTIPAMKKTRQDTRVRSRPLQAPVQAPDLASVRGGDNGVISSRNLHVGISPHDDGVIHSRN